ncbi:MAG: hypothetical protein WD847_09025 [Pirellulales bacterium]
MDIVAPFTLLASAAVNAKKLFEASKALSNAEMKQMIADLAMQMAEVSLEMATLKHEIVRLQVENAALKDKATNEKPKLKWGCYQFEGDETLYCPKCWETQHRKHPTTRVMSGRFRKCSICDAMMGTG